MRATQYTFYQLVLNVTPQTLVENIKLSPLFLSQNLSFLLQSAVLFDQLLVFLQQLEQLVVVLNYFLMLISINGTDSDIPLDNAVNFVQDALDVIGEKRFCDT